LRNDCLNAALAELEAVGVRDYQLAHGGKHLQLRWSVNGHPLRILTIAGTPSDFRSPLNTRRDIRALLRLDGLLDMPRSNGAAHPTKPDWRQQLGTLACRLRRMNIPHELAAERDAIVAALRSLIDRTTEGSEP
jgi:hypothetical protein